jgi:two-component system OmpR family sensor kinase
LKTLTRGWPRARRTWRRCSRMSLDYAIRYTPSGGRIDLAVHGNEDGTRILVDDTGPGIAPEDRQPVFDRLYRVRGTEQTGSGLGLAIVQTIAARVGASVSLSDAPWADGRSGLRVTVAFPVELN